MSDNLRSEIERRMQAEVFLAKLPSGEVDAMVPLPKAVSVCEKMVREVASDAWRASANLLAAGTPPKQVEKIARENADAIRNPEGEK